MQNSSKHLRPGWRPGAAWDPGVSGTLPRGLPFVFINAAITADGKIAPAGRNFEPFGSRRDELLLYELRTHADAILCGARTVDLNPVKLGNGGAAFTRLRLRRGLSEHPLRVIVSGSGSVNPGAEIFKHRFSPILILTSEAAPERRLKKLRALADEVAVLGKDRIDFTAALRWLREKRGVKRLLCEGGGELNDALLRAGLVHRLYLTICPLIFGGRTAPTLADGAGAQTLAAATRWKLRASRRAGQELFLVFEPDRRRF